MAKKIKAFITRDDFITPGNWENSPIYELSDDSLTYSKRKEIIYPSEHPKYAVHSFGYQEVNKLTNIEANAIVRCVLEFVEHLTADAFSTKQKILSTFITRHNSLFPETPASNIDYNAVVNHLGLRAPDYITFTILDVDCSIWLSENTFNKLYPSYDINIVTPFDNFSNNINNTQETLRLLEEFSIITFNERIEINKDGYPPTVTRIMKIPYRVPNTELERDCYFCFNIYGLQGNHEHILRLELYRFLTEDVGLTPEFVESVFPSVLNINEFFLVPRWDRYAIPSQVGQGSINSQLTRTYTEEFDIEKFVKVYNNPTFSKNNTYSFPCNFNNLLINVLNGFHTSPLVKDFMTYYKDIIAVSSNHPDFNRMSNRTQLFLTILEHFLEIADANSETELFNKIIQNTNHNFNLTERGGITYVTIQFQDHQYYVIPRYEYLLNL